MMGKSTPSCPLAPLTGVRFTPAVLAVTLAVIAASILGNSALTSIPSAFLPWVY